jgi:hypothetical protein
VVTTVGDMYRWVHALARGAVVSEESRRKLFVPRRAPREGYGWHVGKTSWGTMSIDKGGASADFASHVLYFPDDRLIVVWASNDLRQRWRRALNASIPATALGRDSAMPPQVARARPDLVPLVGTYGTDEGVVYVRAGEGYLYVRRNTAGLPDDVMFFAQSPMTYTGFDPAAVENMSLRFTKADDGSLTAAFERGGRITRLRRLLP